MSVLKTHTHTHTQARDHSHNNMGEKGKGNSHQGHLVYKHKEREEFKDILKMQRLEIRNDDIKNISCKPLFKISGPGGPSRLEVKI